MHPRRLPISRRLRRTGKRLIFTLSACFISFFLFFAFFGRHKQTEDAVDNGAHARHIINQSENTVDDGEHAIQIDGALNVHVWRFQCGENLTYLKKSLFFPQYPDEEKFISEFQTEDNSVDYGQKIFGFLHPPSSSLFRFAIASDDTSELWLSTDENPDNKQLVARVFSAHSIAWTGKDQLDKYPDQISRVPFYLRAYKKYYVEVLHKQGTGNGFVRVFWTSFEKTDNDFRLITSQYISLYLRNTSHTEKKVALHNVLSRRYSQEFQQKSGGISNEFVKYYSLPALISKDNFLTSCDYKSSFVSVGKVSHYEGKEMVFVSNVYPPDDTLMSNDTGLWARANRVADKEVIQSVVDKMVAALLLNSSRKYFLKRIHKVLQKSDPVFGDRYSVDLELGVPNTEKSYRFSEHVYQKKGTNSLCLPKGIEWNRNATVYIILPVKDQGRWVYHFINELTVASLLTGDTNFHVLVVDFESQDIDLRKAFADTALLRNRHTIINLTGKFYKTLALNKAIELVPSEHDLLFLFDLHIDVPIDILDSVRKNTIEGKIVFFPAVGRLDCHSTYIDHQGFWQMNGFGLLAVYKSDWTRFGGMNTEDYKYSWGGEDWDLLDRVVNAQLEVERIKYPGLFHHYHSKHKMWN